jgi:hypothetical protein
LGVVDVAKYLFALEPESAKSREPGEDES